MGLEQFELFFQTYAYQPLWVYSGVVLFMLASGFGLPIPEEVTLISSGLVAYMAMNPDIYPPPEGGTPVNAYVLATVAFFAVIMSDTLIFCLGRWFGRPLMRKPFFRRYFSEESLARVEGWVRRRGVIAAGIFRFTPGIRFPGHLMCGAMGLSAPLFLTVDAIAAMISVPTQILLIAFYGETILFYLGRFKYFLAAAIVAFLIVYTIRKLILWRREQTLAPKAAPRRPSE